MSVKLKDGEPLTWEDLLAFPEDNQKREIIGGELIVAPSPVRIHQRLIGRIARLIEDAADAQDAGEMYRAPLDVRLTPYDAVQPDVLFIRTERLGIFAPDGRITGAPDLVVEILSPGARSIDRIRTFALYATAGVLEYWLVDPEASTVQIFALGGDR
ncbi:MAG: Uma2 family endonuclease, partial [Thermomicrobiales bacterium]|nr:Uma2 family endonuclease [Thermomicrobiales bacterium]